MVVPLLGLHEQILPRVSRPNRYIAPFSIKENAEGRICLLYPGPYRRAFADPAFRALLDTLRSEGTGMAVDVSFCPEEDLDSMLAAESIPMFGMASQWPLNAFDLILVFARDALQVPTALRMLKRGTVDASTQVFLCGPLGLWADPVGSLFDGVLVGDPEAFSQEILGGTLLEREGVWSSASTEPVSPRWLTQLPPPSPSPIVPLCELEPEGFPLEISRARGVADAYYASPVLHREGENVLRATENVLRETGFGQVIWGGVEATGHPELVVTLERLHGRVYANHQTARLGWVRAEELTPGLARELHKGRRGHLKFSPMALSERLRAQGGRPLTPDTLREALQLAGRGGWQYVELSALVGVPGEDAQDVQEFEQLLEHFTEAGVRKTLPKLRVNLQPYCPKPHTPGAQAELLPQDRFGSWTLALKERYKKGSRIKISEGDAGAAHVRHSVFQGDPATLKALSDFAASPGLMTEMFTAELPGETPDRNRASLIQMGSLPETLPETLLPQGSPPVSSRANGRRVRRGAPKHADRYRLRFAKDDQLRFASHLEVIRALERGFIGAQVPLSWSQGKDPRPKMAFGPSLAVGITSDTEYMDIALSRETGETFVERVNERLPQGLSLVQCSPIRNEAASLGSSIDVAAYRVSFPRRIREDHPSSQDLRERLQANVSQMLASDSLSIHKIKKDKSITLNARPSILSAAVVQDVDGYPAFEFRIRLNRPETVRPHVLASTLCDPLEVDERTYYVHRTGLFVSGGQGDLDPMQVIQRDFAWWRESLRGGVTQ